MKRGVTPKFADQSSCHIRQYAHYSGEFQPQRENNAINSGHNFYLAGLLLGKHTHSACTKIVSEPILCLYNMKMMNTDQ